MKNLEGERKFSGVRLYKFVKGLVIGISLLAGIYGGFLAATVEPGYISKFERICKGLPYYDDCMLNAYNAQSDLQNRILISFAIAISLPVIFFASVGLYRYLFPNASSK